MKIQIPKTFMGKPVAGSLERVLNSNGNSTPDPSSNPPTNPPTTVPDLQGYIYVPAIGLYLAKQKTHHNLNWHKTHEELAKENLRMPTIYEFKEYLRYLRQNQSGVADASAQEVTTILDDILTVRSPWRAEWLDARFEQRENELYLIERNNPSNAKLLELCLMEDKTPGIDLEEWLNNSTKQGLPNPKTKQGQLHYWYPRANYVAWFVADSDWASLGYSRIPTFMNSSRGVFAVREAAEPKNLG
jgi:hypothetical protein